MINSNPKPADPNQFRAGPILHETLSPELLKQIRVIYEVIGNYLDTTLEQFEISFMRDADPDVDVAIWCSITVAWGIYPRSTLLMTFCPTKKKRNFSELCWRSQWASRMQMDLVWQSKLGKGSWAVTSGWESS